MAEGLSSTLASAAATTLAAAASATMDAVAAAATGEAGDVAGAEEELPPPCPSANEYNGDLGLRISAIFVILVGSLLGAVFPVWARNNEHLPVPGWAFFVAKYFGSGVIIATAFIHLLAPANEAFGNECLAGPITEYPWPEGIVLMSIFVLFFVELMAMRFAVFDPTHEHGTATPPGAVEAASLPVGKAESSQAAARRASLAHTPGEDHLSHSRDHPETDDEHAHPRSPSSGTGNGNGTTTGNPTTAAATLGRRASATSAALAGTSGESYTAQLTAIFILEFGIVFHSVLIGLTLAVAGDEFRTLYAVLVFHQTFEGLGLGSRLAVVPWPRRFARARGPDGERRKAIAWTPYLLAGGYALSTPVALAIGIGVRYSLVMEGETALLAQGAFDSVSAGILIYTGLVELMAHEFMFSGVMRRASLSVVLAAFGIMCFGAGIMALLGKWA